MIRQTMPREEESVTCGLLPYLQQVKSSQVRQVTATVTLMTGSAVAGSRLAPAFS